MNRDCFSLDRVSRVCGSGRTGYKKWGSKVSNPPFQGLDPGGTSPGIFRFDERKAANDKMVPDHVGSAFLMQNLESIKRIAQQRRPAPFLTEAPSLSDNCKLLLPSEGLWWLETLFWWLSALSL
jgi:hypothetical protein